MSSRLVRASITQAVRSISYSRTPILPVRQYVSTTFASPSYQIMGRHSPALISKRWHSSPSDRPKQYEFEDVKSFSTSPSSERIIIGKLERYRNGKHDLIVPDVREPAEYKAGYIPGAINVPVKSQPDAIFLTEEEFEDRFGFTKPPQEKEIVFYCRAGVRSSAAATLAQQQGYKNISEYRGSWLDWEKNGGPIAKP